MLGGFFSQGVVLYFAGQGTQQQLQMKRICRHRDIVLDTKIYLQLGEEILMILNKFLLNVS
ncbi:hypothetical protein SOASR014_39410 [Pectobacterium carotovorum subsp. carotovorum]|nr:hypothetical protein SOASR014_39410 [Pectobacterium carotovorum subsp. carotovorum]GLX43807.1 hypothetical protein Pcaca01_14750 [Pectobacterium carotovorum subsp. carotovorum]